MKKYIKLKQCGNYILSPKILTNNLSKNNYITTDNMLPNKEGITQSKNIPLNLKVTQFLKNDILLSNIRPYFKKIWLAKFMGGCSADVLVFRTNSNYDPAYIKHCLSQDAFFAYDMAGSKGSKMPRGDKDHILNFKLLDLDIKEQQKIGRILSNIDEKIAVNNEINKLLEQSARAIYEYYFVQFDFPNANGKPYKSSGGEMIFNPTLNHHIPKTFEVKVMKDFLSVVTGKEDANFATKNGQYAFFTCGDEILRCDKSVFKGKAILIAGNGNFNVKYFDGEFNAYQRTYVLIPKNELYAGILYFSALNRIDIFTKGSNGSIVKFITKGDIENIPVILPNDTQILSVFNTILDKQNLIRIENQKLKALRDFLLPLLLNAQVKIK